MSPGFGAMHLQVLRGTSPGERDLWKGLLDRIQPERRDYHFRPEYLVAHELDGRGEALCAAVADGERVFLYPFLLSPVSLPTLRGRHHDVQSPYGYSGPILSTQADEPSFLRACWRTFSEWCVERGVVAEFVRFHPLVNNHRWAPEEMTVQRNRSTVAIHLSEYESGVWSDPYYRTHRNMIRKAERTGLHTVVVSATAALRWFPGLYTETHTLLGGSSETRFSREYFASLMSSGSDAQWVEVVKGGEDLVTAAWMLDGEYVTTAHLMCYSATRREAGATNLLYHGAAIEAGRRGKQLLQMGGGRSGDSDPLYRFKCSLSPHRAEFHIGKRCHNSAVYAQLVAEWEQRNKRKNPGHFLVYRT